MKLNDKSSKETYIGFHYLLSKNMCSFCCITFREYMIAEKTLLDYTNLFSPYDNKKVTR